MNLKLKLVYKMMMKSKEMVVLDSPGLISIDKEEIRQIQRQIDAPIGGGTVDQLGFGLLFDSISEVLFPWCSTLTTRAKYLLWSPVVLELAAENIKINILKKKEWSSLTKEKQSSLLDQFQREVNKIESFLSLTLFWKYKIAKKEELGIFGKSNISKRMNDGYVTSEKIIKKGVLSTSARYPNAIYRNSLVTLGLFKNNRINNQKMFEIFMIGGNPYSADWYSVTRNTKREIRHIYELLSGKNKLEPSEIFTKKSLDRFNGFSLNDDEKIFLRDKIVKKTDFWNPLLTRKVLGLVKYDSSDFQLFASKSKQNKHKELFEMAKSICEVASPFINLYKKLTVDGSRLDDLSKVDWFSDVDKKLANLERLFSKNKDIQLSEKAKGCIEFVRRSIVILKKHKFAIEPELVRSIAGREKKVLRSRGKVDKVLLKIGKDIHGAYQSTEAKNKYIKRNRPIDEELEMLSETTFRLGSALQYFRDIENE